MPRKSLEASKRGRSFLLTARYFLLTVIWFGLFYVRLKLGLVFFACGGKSVWSFLLTVPPRPEIGFGLFYLRFPHRK